MKYSIFIFHRDLRLIDNKGLMFAMHNYVNIIPIFIFTPEQITNNKYKSNNAVQFMCYSLIELNDNLQNNNSKLHMFYGDTITIIEQIIKTINVSSIIFNMDYTPYARGRDKNVEQLCNDNNIDCHMIEDYLLAPIGTFLKQSDNCPYTIYGPFKNNAKRYTIDKPDTKFKIINLIKLNKLNECKMIKYIINENILVRGGRINGLQYLNKIRKHDNYNNDRNILNIPTTYLSAYIKFGCISIREVYWKIIDNFGKDNDLLGQIFWREFYYYIAYYFPHVLKGKNFNPKYDKIKWKWSKKNYIAWTKGETGYPVVDAGMRELNRTGFMHNRARLITSNFLNRILGLDWRWSELYYAQMLTDYDPAVNSGNHQWIASVGVDPKPYFQRLFNPWLQSKKFDSDAIYIKKWIPELENVPAKDIHDWSNAYTKYNLEKIKYFKPIVDYGEGREESIKMYRKVLK